MAEVAQGYKGPSPKSFDLDENFKPKHTLLCCDIEIFHNLRTFSNTLGKKSPYPNNCIPTFSFLLPSSCQSSQSSCLVFKTIQEKEKNTFENFGKIPFHIRIHTRLTFGIPSKSRHFIPLLIYTHVNIYIYILYNYYCGFISSVQWSKAGLAQKRSGAKNTILEVFQFHRSLCIVSKPLQMTSKGNF